MKTREMVIIVVLIFANIGMVSYIGLREMYQLTLCSMAKEGTLSHATMKQVNIDSFCERT